MMNLNWIKPFCKQFNIKVKYQKNLHGGGEADIPNRTILLNQSRIFSKDFNIGNIDVYVLHVVCHEVCHILCKDYKKYYNYHTLIFKEDLTKQEIQLIRRTGLKAERYCDKMAWKMIESFWPNQFEYPQTGNYSTDYAKKWYHNGYLRQFKV